MTDERFGDTDREPYLQALDQARDALYIVRDSEIDAVNQELVDLTGYDRDTLAGASPTKLLHDDEQTEHEQRRQLLSEDAETDSVKWLGRFVTKHGTQLPVELQYTLLTTDEEGFVARAHDVREQEQQEQKLTILNRALRHNIRNQMNIIIAHSVNLQEIEDPNYRTSAESIETVGKEIINLSEKARKAQQHLDIPPDEECQVDLVEAIEQVTQSFEITHPNSSVTTDLPEKAVALAPPSVEVALMELMENATEHHPSGSGPVEVDIDAGQDTVTVHVKDNCEPIPETAIDTVQRGTEDPLKHNEGLGLWIVRWVADTVEAELTFGRREDGAGNRVTLAFEALEEG